MGAESDRARKPAAAFPQLPAGRRLRLEGISRDGLERAGDLPLRLGSVDGRGLLAELADQLSQRASALVRRRREAV